MTQPLVAELDARAAALTLRVVSEMYRDPFWSAPSEPTTSERAWSGQSFPIDKAYSEA